MDDSRARDQEGARTRRLAAELRLADTLHKLVIHELGNPLQSLLVLIELTRDELHAHNERGSKRLDRALASIERLRQVLVTSGRVRGSLSRSSAKAEGEPSKPICWGPLLDSQLELAKERAAASLGTLSRSTDEIDELPVTSDDLREALLAALLGACQHLRASRVGQGTVEVRGRALEDQVCVQVILAGADGPVEIDPPTVDWVSALLACADGCRCEVEAGALLLWAPRA